MGRSPSRRGRKAEATDGTFRFDGVTGAFIDIFVEEGSGGLGEPTFIRFAPHLGVPEPGASPGCRSDCWASA